MLYVILFCAGGFFYVCLECVWRGRSHVSMAITGGTCVVLLYGVLSQYPRLALQLRALIGTVIVTAVEFVAGAIVNIRLRLHVWDYTDLPYNCYGQICFRYSFYWFLLSAIMAVVVDVISSMIHTAI